MSSLRERQKENRRRNILQAAREQFVESGFETTTIETIAAQAEVSSVTVYNYYGTKTGLLLALVAESDALLRERMDALLSDPPDTIGEAFSAFAATIREHALSFLTKPVWRQVIAASIVEGDSQFGRAYAQLDRELARLMAKILEKLRARGRVNALVDLDILGQSLFHLQNARFTQFISIDGLQNETVDRYLREDIAALLAAAPAGSPT
ncbi:TetR/AcrR family transcriptional regulator [Breoghania sp. L-A4]|uniref:TetR/AcrR family transcriptional regulator n=1 Tax=Breoghania sp. L-A4 TaxID=2304600 RepID=UPI000E35ED08|nr:TetR/AcrR family transcriptional regulator [Breoghania sp. L-A4]AXS41564.1 TetR/AcrR family transcriptional regulator [Breoghania sp. L-A4]